MSVVFHPATRPMSSGTVRSPLTECAIASERGSTRTRPRSHAMTAGADREEERELVGAHRTEERHQPTDGAGNGADDAEADPGTAARGRSPRQRRRGRRRPGRCTSGRRPSPRRPHHPRRGTRRARCPNPRHRGWPGSRGAELLWKALVPARARLATARHPPADVGRHPEEQAQEHLAIDGAAERSIATASSCWHQRSSSTSSRRPVAS